MRKRKVNIIKKLKDPKLLEQEQLELEKLKQRDAEIFAGKRTRSE